MFFVFKLNTKYEIFDSICGYLNVLFHFFISERYMAQMGECACVGVD